MENKTSNSKKKNVAIFSYTIIIFALTMYFLFAPINFITKIISIVLVLVMFLASALTNRQTALIIIASLVVIINWADYLKLTV